MQVAKILFEQEWNSQFFFFFLRTQVFLEFSFGLNYSPVSFGELDVNLEKKEGKNVRRR